MRCDLEREGDEIVGGETAATCTGGRERFVTQLVCSELQGFWQTGERYSGSPADARSKLGRPGTQRRRPLGVARLSREQCDRLYAHGNGDGAACRVRFA